jgi:tRNA threonylcarbamoyladenosine biosynthesis protein TsaB
VKILAIDTATENCSAALLIDGNIRSRELETERGHADRILTMIDELLCEAGVSLGDLHAIAFGRGPGSFTGVRLAATVTQGLAFGAGLGVVPISDLQAVAQRALAAAAEATTAAHQPPSVLTRILVCNDARMGEVYWACYERGPDGFAQLEGEEHVSKPGDVKLPATWATATPAGRGFIVYADALYTAVPSLTRTAAADVSLASLGLPSLPPSADPLTHLLPRAPEIGLLAVSQVAAGRLLGPEAATPIYLRDNVAHVVQPSKPPREPR